jgi:hypothetical protein
MLHRASELAGPCEHENESSGPLQGREFLDKLSVSQEECFNYFTFSCIFGSMFAPAVLHIPASIHVTCSYYKIISTYFSQFLLQLSIMLFCLLLSLSSGVQVYVPHDNMLLSNLFSASFGIYSLTDSHEFLLSLCDLKTVYGANIYHIHD